MPQDVDPEFLRDAARILSQMPPAKKLVLPPETQTCVCGKQVSLTKLSSLNTGVFLTLNDVCKGCKEGARFDQTHARLVCARCKRVIMRIPPSTDKTGFKFEANKSYHVDGCPQCDLLSKKANFTIIEKAMWNRMHQIPRTEPTK